LTALEYNNGNWEIILYHDSIDTIEELVDQIEDELNENSNFNPEKLLQTILK